MALLHACPLCGWSVRSEQPTVLEPRCPQCGCEIEAVSSEIVAREAPTAPFVPFAADRRLEWVLMALLVSPLVLAAGKVGWGSAGAPGAATALLVVLLTAYVALAPARRTG